MAAHCARRWHRLGTYDVAEQMPDEERTYDGELEFVLTHSNLTHPAALQAAGSY